MSIILDALKKLDRERSYPPEGPPNIDIEILRPDPPLRRKRIQLYFGTIFLTAIVATAITYAVVTKFVYPPKPLPPAPVNSPVQKQKVTPVLPEANSASKSPPPTSVKSPASKQKVMSVSPKADSLSKPLTPTPMDSPVPKQEVIPIASEANAASKSLPAASMNSSAAIQQGTPAPVSQEPAPAGHEEATQESPKIQNPTGNKDPIPPSGERKEGQSVVSGAAAIAPGDKAKDVQPISGEPVGSPPSFKITVISWYEDPSERFAFINGTMAHEGEIIEEAKIVEIYPDRVLFLHKGQYFEISM